MINLMKNKNRVIWLSALMAVIVLLSGCNSTQMTAKSLEAKLLGLSVNIRTFDEESQVIDQISGKSVMV